MRKGSGGGGGRGGGRGSCLLFGAVLGVSLTAWRCSPHVEPNTMPTCMYGAGEYDAQCFHNRRSFGDIASVISHH